MERSRVSVWIYLVLVFAGGLVTGLFADRVYTLRTVSAHAVPHNPEEWKRKYIADVKSRCQLTDTQVDQVSQVLDDTRRKAEGMRARLAPEWAALHSEQVRRVRELMAGPQVAEFDRFRAEREAQHKARSKD